MDPQIPMSNLLLNRYMPLTHDFHIENALLESDVPAFLKFTANIRVAWQTKEDMKLWIREFSKLTRTDWIQREMTDWKSFKYLGAFSAKFICQQSSYGKSEHSERDANCHAEIFVNFVRDPSSRKRIRGCDLLPEEIIQRRNDSILWKRGLKFRVRIQFSHTHSLESPGGLRMLRSKVDDIYYALFTAGIGPQEAYDIFQRMHGERFANNPVEQLANSENPNYEHVQYLYKRHIGAFVPANYDAQLDTIEHYLLEHYEASEIRVSVSRDPLAIAIVTPLMRRARLFSAKSDVILVDVDSACDVRGHSLAFLYTPTPAGVVPIGCFITTNQSSPSLFSGFALLKQVFETDGDDSLYSPRHVIYGGSPAMLRAIELTWPEAEIFVNRFQKLQKYWHHLINNSMDIPTENYGYFIRGFKRLMTRPNIADAQCLFERFVSSPKAAPFPRVVENLKAEWTNRNSWLLAFRPEHLRNSFPIIASEASVRAHRDLFENRQSASTLIEIITKVIAECNSYFSERMVDCALNTDTPYRKQLHTLVEEFKCSTVTTYLDSSDDNLFTDSNNEASSSSVCLVRDGSPTRTDTTEVDVDVELQQVSQYLVDVFAGTCECPVSQSSFACCHLDAARTHLIGENLPKTTSSSVIPAEANQQTRLLLIEVATGEPASEAALPWNIQNEVIVDDEGSDCLVKLPRTSSRISHYPGPSGDGGNSSNLSSNAICSPVFHLGLAMDSPGPSTSSASLKRQTDIRGNGEVNEDGSPPAKASRLSQETIVQLTSKFSRQIFDALHEQADHPNVLQFAGLIEQACDKLGRLRSMNGYRRFFLGAIDACAAPGQTLPSRLANSQSQARKRRSS